MKVFMASEGKILNFCVDDDGLETVGESPTIWRVVGGDYTQHDPRVSA
jgi:hypothetical protein